MIKAETSRFCVLIMGVSGAGKTTIGKALAKAMDGYFLEGDDLHPIENIKKMKCGLSLNDMDRWPWLDQIIETTQKEMERYPVIISCSALKEAYRKKLNEIDYRLVYLKGEKELIRHRLSKRSGHFMPVSLIDSQFSDLEEPDNAITVPVTLEVGDIVDYIIQELV